MVGGGQPIGAHVGFFDLGDGDLSRWWVPPQRVLTYGKLQAGVEQDSAAAVDTVGVVVGGPEDEVQTA